MVLWNKNIINVFASHYHNDEEHIETLKECEISDEFKEKIKHLAETSMKEDEGIRLVCENFGIELEKENNSSE